MKIILDVGSTHNKNLNYCYELIDLAAEFDCDIKFQLFKNKPPNIELPYKWFPILKKYADKKGVELFASIWDEEAMDLVYECGCQSIKFAYSMRNSDLIKKANKKFQKVYVSGDTMTDFPDKVIKLYCIPEYPVKYKIDFEGIFPYFDGFSDHTLGIKQAIKAIKSGAKYLEKHITLDYNDISCPDSKFALHKEELKKLYEAIKKQDLGY